jgi:hypothetical protein
MSNFIVVDRKLNTPGILLYKQDQDSGKVCVYAASRDNTDLVEEFYRVRLTSRSSAISVMVDANPRTPIPLHVCKDDEIWISSECECVAWCVVD